MDENAVLNYPKATDKGAETQSYVVVEIYDLNNSEIVYSRKETGLKRYEHNSPSKIRNNKVSNEMMLDAFKWIWKNIRKKRIR